MIFVIEVGDLYMNDQAKSILQYYEWIRTYCYKERGGTYLIWYLLFHGLNAQLLANDEHDI